MLRIHFALFFMVAMRIDGAAILVPLGTVGPFAVLAGSTVTNTGSSVVKGNLGVWPGSAATGFPPGVVTLPSVMHLANAVALQAQSDLTTAYNQAAGQPCGTTLTGQDLGGLTLVSGVYCFSSSAQLTGALTLDAQGSPNPVFVFQIGTTLTTASNSSVGFVNGGQGLSVFWQVGTSATLGTTTSFLGNILALSSITLNTGANIVCGRALARNEAVTMDTNTIDPTGCAAASSSSSSSSSGGGEIPEPGTSAMLGLGLLLAMFGHRRAQLSR